MRFSLTLLSLFVTLSTASAAGPALKAAPAPVAKGTRLLCKTGAENRPAAQALKLYFQYHLPVLFEAEDPTVPFGRQVMVLSGRPVVQVFFDKFAGAAGENGEKLAPMTCAFANRAVATHEPSQVQVFLPSGQVHWLTQNVGQRPGPKQLSFERAVVNPAGDWAFAAQFEKVFSIELEDTKTFVTTQLPKAL